MVTFWLIVDVLGATLAGSTEPILLDQILATEVHDKLQADTKRKFETLKLIFLAEKDKSKISKVSVVLFIADLGFGPVDCTTEER